MVIASGAELVIMVRVAVAYGRWAGLCVGCWALFALRNCFALCGTASRSATALRFAAPLRGTASRHRSARFARFAAHSLPNHFLDNPLPEPRPPSFPCLLGIQLFQPILGNGCLVDPLLQSPVKQGVVPVE